MPFLAPGGRQLLRFSHLSLPGNGKVATRRLKSLKQAWRCSSRLEMAFTTNTLSLVVNAQESGDIRLLGPIRRNS